MPRQHRVDRVARRPRHVADEHALCAQQPVHERRLADVRTADDGDGDFGRGIWDWDSGFARDSGFGRTRDSPRYRAPRRCRRPRLASCVSPLSAPRRATISSSRSATPVPVLGGNLDDRLDPERVEIHRRVPRALVVDLVDRQNHRPVGLAQLARDRLVARDESFAAVDDEHQQIGADDRALALTDDELVQRILAGAVQAAGVEQLKRHAPPDGRTRQRIAGRAGHRRDDRAARTGDAVEERRFPDVRASDQHDRGSFSGHV